MSEKLEQEREYLQKKVESLVGKSYQINVRPMTEEELKIYQQNKHEAKANLQNKSKISVIEKILNKFSRLK